LKTQEPSFSNNITASQSFLYKSPAKTKRINDIDKIDKFIEKELLKLKNPNYNTQDH
jgi:hypothetical protein